MTNAYSENYLKNQIETASREQLLLMFYDGAIRFVSRAMQAIDNDDIEQRNYCIKKAGAIITELSVTLDHGIGGQIAADLEALYDFMNRELLKANSAHDAEPLVIVKSLLTDLHETWKGAIEITKQAAKPTVIDVQEHKPLSVSL